MMGIVLFVLGCWVGIFVMCLLHVARDPVESGCTGDCNQGRRCDCRPMGDRAHK